MEAKVETKRIRKGVAAAVIASFGFVGVGVAAPPAMAWLHPGPTTQYPSSGGTWQYGFWNVKVRSYYTVNRCHGSSVKLNGSLSRSADTRAGVRSTAEKYAVNTPGADDAYYYRTC
ncbi:hypothetical protein ATP06_0214655 [Amycolatopsis regifaucium]|uniref:Lactococcin 972 family bacteriocin n=2 Tax=Amycolatopsis regifaucium TaxID=546365 RepID=A0ABX3DT62_9PSEU|nr:hypothetical protein ATP06_0214655 [Amycolatopsis regifaucium]SFI57608.1 Bacteriocin (Lactococcin_972) [Amycolatopsis regifaucium]